MIPVIVTVPVPALTPELVMAPILLMLLVVSVTPAARALLLLMIRSPVPVTPLATVSADPPAVLVSVVPPVFTLRAVVLIVSPEPTLFCVMAVTLAPIPPEITLSPVLVPELVMVPVLLTLAVESVRTPAPLELIVRLPVPVMPPLKVSAVPPPNTCKSWLLSVIAPLKTLVDTVPVMVAIPVLVEATVIGLVKVPLRPPLKVALADPPEASPMIIVPVPNAVALVVPLTVPALIVKLVLKVLDLLSVSVPLPNFRTPDIAL